MRLPRGAEMRSLDGEILVSSDWCADGRRGRKELNVGMEASPNLPLCEDLNVLSISSAAMGVTSEAAMGTTVSGDRMGASMA